MLLALKDNIKNLLAWFLFYYMFEIFVNWAFFLDLLIRLTAKYENKLSYPYGVKASVATVVVVCCPD